MFERPVYTVSESDGIVPDTIQIVKDLDTELVYKFNVSLRSGDRPATEGQPQYTCTVSASQLAHTCTHCYNSHPCNTYTPSQLSHIMSFSHTHMDHFL